jgi:putative ABC transport system permease protein
MIVATVAIVVASLLAVGGLQLAGSSFPPIRYVAACGVCILLTALVATLVPACVAASRDPVAELRVP